MYCINCGTHIGIGAGVCSAACLEDVLVTFTIRAAGVRAGIIPEHELFEIGVEYRGRDYIGPRRPILKTYYGGF